MEDKRDYGDRFDPETLEAAARDAAERLEGPCSDAVAGLAKEGRAISVIGRVVDGKIEIDESAIEEFARRFPDANGTFVAVNAPFDKEFSAQLLEA